MKNKNLWMSVGVAALLIGGYFVIRNMKKKKKDEDFKGKQEPIEGLDTPAVLPSEPTPSSPTLIGGFAGIAQFLTNWNDYVVNTKTSSLNVRKNPDSKSAIVDSLRKGSVIKAKASGVKGWFAVSRDGETTLGYVAQEFIKPKN